MHQQRRQDLFASDGQSPLSIQGRALHGLFQFDALVSPSCERAEYRQLPQPNQIT